MLVAKGMCTAETLNGEVSVYMRGEKIMSCTYHNNVRHGTYVEFTNGVVTTKVEYSNGHESSIKQIFDPATGSLIQDDGMNRKVSRGKIMHCRTQHGNHVIAEGGASIRSNGGKNRIQYESFFSREDESGQYFNLYFIPSDFSSEVTSSADFTNPSDGENCLLLRRINRVSNRMEVFCKIPGNPQFEEKIYEGRFNPEYKTKYAREGHGKEFFTNGIQLVGNYKNDQVDGYANFVDSNGRCFCHSFWDCGRIKEVTFFSPSGSVFEQYAIDDWNEVLSSCEGGRNYFSNPSNAMNRNKKMPIEYTAIDFRTENSCNKFYGNSGIIDFSPFLFVRRIRLASAFPKSLAAIHFVHLPCLEEIQLGKDLPKVDYASYKHLEEPGQIVPEADEQVLTIAYCNCLRKVVFGDDSCQYVTKLQLFGK